MIERCTGCFGNLVPETKCVSGTRFPIRRQECYQLFMQVDTRDKYAQFVIDSVEKVFTSPVDSKGRDDFSDLKRKSTEQLKLLAELIHVALQGRK